MAHSVVFISPSHIVKTEIKQNCRRSWLRFTFSRPSTVLFYFSFSMGERQNCFRLFQYFISGMCRRL